MRLRPILDRFRRDDSGSSAAEFVLVLPLALIFLLGIIDAGRYMWNVNQGLKAVQIGARWAAATDFMPQSLVDYSFMTDCAGCNATQGDPVPESDFGGYSCTDTGLLLECNCLQGKTCKPSLTTDNDDHLTFLALVGRMQDIFPAIGVTDVTLTYSYNGLGFAGDPNGADVAPDVTIAVDNVAFSPTSLFGTVTLNLPDFSQTLTMEDGQGDSSN